jgi:transposase
MLAFIGVESRIPLDHPLRTIKYMADYALTELSPMFDAMYAEIGRPSLPPEPLLKASLLISLYSVRSEQPFCEQLDYNLLFRWFQGMTTVEPSFDPLTFSKNRRLRWNKARVAVHRRQLARGFQQQPHQSPDRGPTRRPPAANQPK